MNTRQLLSVGIDIGTTTTQVIFSRLELVNRAAVSQVPRYEFIKRDISWQSPVFFTPVDKQGGLKEVELKALILAQYQAAGIAPESVDSGLSLSPAKAPKPATPVRRSWPSRSRWATLWSPAPGRIWNRSLPVTAPERKACLSSGCAGC